MKLISAVYLLFIILIFSANTHAQQSSDASLGADAKTTAAEEKAALTGFKSDGCTMWFDANYKDCCQQHDLDYWNWRKTGGWRGRLRADNDLFLCIAGKGSINKLLAPVIWTGVRVFGSPLSPTHKRSLFFKTSRKIMHFLGNSGSRRKADTRRAKSKAAKS